MNSMKSQLANEQKRCSLYDYTNNFNKFDGDPLPDKNRILQFLMQQAM